MFLIQTTLARLIRIVLSRHWSVGFVGTMPDLPQDRPLIIVSNHHSALDPFVWGSVVPLQRPYVPARFIVKYKYFKRNKPRWLWKWVGIAGRRILRMLWCLPTDARNLDYAIAALERQHTIFIYPEGRRSEHRIMQDARRGTAMMACATGAIILPLAVRGTLIEERRGLQRAFMIAAGEPLMFSRIAHPTAENITHGTNRIVRAIADVQEMLYESI